MVPGRIPGSYISKRKINMALSAKARRRLEVALANRAQAKEVADACDLAGSKIANVAAVATANASDLATAQALANQLKVTLNDLISKAIAAGIMSAS